MGGKDDWLVTTNGKCELRLVNLIASDTVLLRSLSTIKMIEVSEFCDLDLVCNHCIHTLRRVVLCRTPSNASGHLAIALFADRLLAYMTKGDDV